MEESTRLKILQTFEDRQKEGHPFQTSSRGLKDFARLIPLVEQLSKEEVETFLVPLIDDLLKKLGDCLSCRAKLLVFAEMFCARSRLQAFRYRRFYKHSQEECLKVSEDVRDFRGEVQAVVARYYPKRQMG